MNALGAILIAILPTSEPVRDRTDTIELNRVYSYEGCLTLTQWIFWDRGEVRAWRIFHGEKAQRDFDRGGYVLRWHDGDVFRELRALSFIETDYQFDIEIEERSKLDKERRRPLLEGIHHASPPNP